VTGLLNFKAVVTREKALSEDLVPKLSRDLASKLKPSLPGKAPYPGA
jgi:hypothetical protein